MPPSLPFIFEKSEILLDFSPNFDIIFPRRTLYKITKNPIWQPQEPNILYKDLKTPKGYDKMKSKRRFQDKKGGRGNSPKKTKE